MLDDIKESGYNDRKAGKICTLEGRKKKGIKLLLTDYQTRSILILIIPIELIGDRGRCGYE